MAKHGTTDIHSDAPPTALRDPSASAAGLAIDPDDSHDLIGRTVTINVPRQELYAFWRDFRNLPLFMENIEERARCLDGDRSHWVVRARRIDRGVGLGHHRGHPRRIASRGARRQGASVPNSGRIEFRDSSNGRGTQVTVNIAYDPPAGKLGKLFAKIFRREPNIQARHELRRFKQLMETGEIPTS